MVCKKTTENMQHSASLSNNSSVLNMPVVFGIPHSESCYPANSPDNRWPGFVKLVQNGHHPRQSHLSTLVIQKDLNCTGPNF